MKKLILFLICLIIGIILYQKINHNKNIREENLSQSKEILSVEGKVTKKFSIIGHSVYELVSLKDTLNTYLVICHGGSPSIGDIRNVSLKPYDLLVFNDDRVTIYIESRRR